MANDKPKGVGGWLLLFVLGQVLFAPLRAVEMISQIWQQIGPHPFPVVRQMVMIATVIVVIMTAYGFVVGVLIWKGNKHGRALARQYLLIQIGVAVLIFVGATAWGYNNLGTSGAQRMASSVAAPTAMTVGVCLLWFTYFTYSRRIRNTYCGETEC